MITDILPLPFHTEREFGDLLVERLISKGYEVAREVPIRKRRADLLVSYTPPFDNVCLTAAFELKLTRNPSWRRGFQQAHDYLAVADEAFLCFPIDALDYFEDDDPELVALAAQYRVGVVAFNHDTGRGLVDFVPLTAKQMPDNVAIDEKLRAITHCRAFWPDECVCEYHH